MEAIGGAEGPVSFAVMVAIVVVEAVFFFSFVSLSQAAIEENEVWPPPDHADPKLETLGSLGPYNRPAFVVSFWLSLVRPKQYLRAKHDCECHLNYVCLGGSWRAECDVVLFRHLANGIFTRVGCWLRRCLGLLC